MTAIFDWLDWFLVAYETQVVCVIALGLAAYCVHLCHKLRRTQEALDTAVGAVNALLRRQNATDLSIKQSGVLHTGEVVDERNVIIAEYTYN